MNFVTILFCIASLIFSCRPAGKIQKSQVVSKVDTASVISVSDNNLRDSGRFVKDVYDKVLKNKIDFTTFNAKVKVAYSEKEVDEDATAYIRVKKDSLIWLSLRGALGIEGFRVLITKDSVTVINLLQKNVQYKNISFLQQVTGLPFTFYTLQDVILGNAVFIDSNIVSHQVIGNELKLEMTGAFIKNLISLDTTDYKILQTTIQETRAGRTCHIRFGKYDNAAGISFSTERLIAVEGEQPLKVDLDIKQYSFNQPLTFPFNIPENFNRQ